MENEFIYMYLVELFFFTVIYNKLFYIFFLVNIGEVWYYVSYYFKFSIFGYLERFRYCFYCMFFE